MDKNSVMLYQTLSSQIHSQTSMELINYQELKREAYLMAIKQLEEEHLNDLETLQKLQEFKIKYSNKTNSPIDA